MQLSSHNVSQKVKRIRRFLRKSAVFCGFLRKSAVSCGFLRKAAPPKCYNSQEICENLRKTANSARSVPFSLSLLIDFHVLSTKSQGTAAHPKTTLPPPPYMRETGTMWQIGVLAGKPCTHFGSKTQRSEGSNF